MANNDKKIFLFVSTLIDRPLNGKFAMTIISEKSFRDYSVVETIFNVVSGNVYIFS